jgi:hypothetical protein
VAGSAPRSPFSPAGFLNIEQFWSLWKKTRILCGASPYGRNRILPANALTVTSITRRQSQPGAGNEETLGGQGSSEAGDNNTPDWIINTLISIIYEINTLLSQELWA